MKLNLTTTNPAEQAIKAYLEANATTILAEKINFGTPIEKDGKQLVNRKTLQGFFKYAESEARKLAEKGANFACVADNVVFGWAIHYFEESAIEGELFNLDGTPYKKIITPASAKEKKAKILPTPKPNLPKPTEAYQSQPKPTKKNAPEQMSIFDLF